eukprot:GHVH01016609.1.p1 GENE.GHVH01016609.1~~GHVH01016609.1.p1  ORF type:complete len:217 (+),score=33.82 GHVH01016609.1:1225-1875(+)
MRTPVPGSFTMAPFGDTPVGKRSMSVSKRTSVDWDILTNLGTDVIGGGGKDSRQEDVFTEELNGTSSRTSSACELYQGLEGPQDLDHVRGVQRIQKMMRRREKPKSVVFEFSAAMAPVDRLLTGESAKLKLAADESHHEIRHLLSEYHNLKSVASSESSAGCDVQECLCILEDLLNRAESVGLIGLGCELDATLSSTDVDDYEVYVTQIEKALKKR